MQSENSKRNYARRTQAFAALFAAMVMIGVSAWPAQAGYFVYVVDGRNDVSIIDTATKSVVATIRVAGSASGIALTPDGNYVYVTNYDADSVSVIRTTSKAVTGNIPVGRSPNSVAITSDGTRAYVSNNMSNNVSVIDTRDQKVIATVQVGAKPTGAFGVAISPDGKRVYVTNAGSGDVSVINTADNAVVATIPLGNPGMEPPVVVSPDGKYAYVGSPAVSVIDTAATRWWRASAGCPAAPLGWALRRMGSAFMSRTALDKRFL